MTVLGIPVTVRVQVRSMWRHVQGYIVEFDCSVARGSDELILMDFAPRAIIKAILCIKPKITFNAGLDAKPEQGKAGWGGYWLTRAIPDGESWRMCSRPLPTRPKFCEEVTARRESL